MRPRPRSVAPRSGERHGDERPEGIDGEDLWRALLVTSPSCQTCHDVLPGTSELDARMPYDDVLALRVRTHPPEYLRTFVDNVTFNAPR